MTALLLLFVPLTAGLAWAWYRRPRPTTEPQCGHCGYNIRGLPSPICPECGHDLRAVGTTPTTDKSRRRYANLIVLHLILCWLGGMLALSFLGNLPFLYYHSTRSTVTLTYENPSPIQAASIHYDLDGYGRPPKRWRGTVKLSITPAGQTTPVTLTLDAATLHPKSPARGVAEELDAQSLAAWFKTNGVTGTDAELYSKARRLVEHIRSRTHHSSGPQEMLDTNDSSSSSSTSSFGGPAPWYPIASLITLSVLWFLGLWLLTKKYGARPISS